MWILVMLDDSSEDIWNQQIPLELDFDNNDLAEQYQ